MYHENAAEAEFSDPTTEEVTVIVTSPRGRNRPSTRRVRWALATLSIVLAGCEIPNFKGPQVQNISEGFQRQPDSYLGRRMFPDLEVVHHDSWVSMAFGEVSRIIINGHPVVLTRADVTSAQNAARATATEPVTFGDVIQYTIDERQAWGWSERLETAERGLDWIAFHVVIPYDTITYAVELFSHNPYFKRVPDTLATIAQSFAIGEVTWNIPLLVFLGLCVVFLISFLRTRAERRQERLQSIRLVKFKKEDDEEDDEGNDEGGESDAPEEPQDIGEERNAPEKPLGS